MPPLPCCMPAPVPPLLGLQQPRPSTQLLVLNSNTQQQRRWRRRRIDRDWRERRAQRCYDEYRYGKGGGGYGLRAITSLVFVELLLEEPRKRRHLYKVY